MVSLSAVKYLLPYRAHDPGALKSQRSYNTAVLPMNPMFHFLFVFGSFLRFRRRVWFTVAIFGSFFISFLVHFYCQLKMVGSKNEPPMRSKMTQKRPKSATVSTPNLLIAIGCHRCVVGYGHQCGSCHCLNSRAHCE